MNFDKLKIDLKDTDPLVRRIAAEELISNNYFDDEIIRIFVDGLSHQDQGFKDISYSGITQTTGEISLKAARDVAQLIKSDNIETRNLSGEILISLGEVSQNYLIEFINDSDRDIRKFAIDLLGIIATDKRIVSAILSKINDEDVNVILSAIEASGNIIERFPEFFDDVLFDTLKSKYFEDDESKVFIIEAFGKINNPKTISFIFERLEQEEDMFLNIACIDALAAYATEKYIVEKLINQIGNINDSLKGVLLKTIIAVSQRLEIVALFPDNLRYIAHNALMDYDKEIRSAGLLAIGSEYYISDIPYLINEIRFFNSDTAQHILYNLIVNSSFEVVRKFIISYTDMINNEDEGDGVTELFTYISNAWLDASPQSKDNVLDTLLDIAIEQNNIFVMKALKVLYDFDEITVQEYITRYYKNLDKKSASVLEDLIYFANV